MTAYVRETHEVRRADDGNVEHIETDSGWMAQLTINNVVWYIAGLLEALLALRFILALLGANPANMFASLVYGISYPFVAPFFSLFNYNSAMECHNSRVTRSSPWWYTQLSPTLLPD